MKLVTLNQIAPWTEDFFFMPYDNRDELVICNPQDSVCVSPAFLRSRKSLEEHIRLVNENHIKRAMIVGENIEFLQRCLSLEEITVYPSINAVNFDFSPLYDMPNLRKLICQTTYGPNEEHTSYVDYSRFSSLSELIINGPKGHKNVHLVRGLTHLALENGQPTTRTLVGAFDGEKLEELSLTESTISSLDGVEQANRIRRLELYYNRRLVDISALTRVRDTLKELDIENCGKIRDFSVLSTLHRLEKLRMVGNNSLPDLSFIHEMPNLKSFTLTMNVEDGNLDMCMSIPYVSIRNRKHFNRRDDEFSKIDIRG